MNSSHVYFSFSNMFPGGILLGPVGAVAGAVTAAAVTRRVSKLGEKRKDRRVEREIARLQNLSQ